MKINNLISGQFPLLFLFGKKKIIMKSEISLDVERNRLHVQLQW